MLTRIKTWNGLLLGTDGKIKLRSSFGRRGLGLSGVYRDEAHRQREHSQLGNDQQVNQQQEPDEDQRPARKASPHRDGRTAADHDQRVDDLRRSVEGDR